MNKMEVLSEKQEGVTSRFLWRAPINEDFERFVTLYKTDKLKARIAFFHNTTDFEGEEGFSVGKGYAFESVVLFEKPNGDFSILRYLTRWGLSVTNKMYKSQKALAALTYKKGSNKFWLSWYMKRKKNFAPLTLSNLRDAFGHQHTNLVEDEIQSRFGWLRYIRENRVLLNVAFNTIVSKKLFSYDTALRHMYKVPLPVAKKLHQFHVAALAELEGRSFAPFLKHMDNIESLTDEQAKDIVFWDTVRMARVLDKKVNCSWGTARLKNEHDAWSKEITNVLFDIKDRPMRIKQIFHEMAEHSGYKMLQTTREMAEEGMVNKHCVATYVSKVERGESAIYHVDGYTLELTKDKLEDGTPILKWHQFRGFKNCEAPEELMTSMKEKLSDFNEQLKKRFLEKKADRSLGMNNDFDRWMKSSTVRKHPQPDDRWNANALQEHGEELDQDLPF